jgi:type VI secretion system protein ImpB
MPQESGPKHIGRNRPPRVQIWYELETYGAMEKVELPFVMGVLADLSGKRDPDAPLKSLRDRKFDDIDAATFNDRMKAIRPSVVSISFENMADFAPDAVARKIEPLRILLEKREQLKGLLAHMDGKEPATKLVGKLLTDPSLQAQVLATVAKPDGSEVASTAEQQPAQA